MERIGQVNQYACETCGDITHTINLNTGVAPLSIACRRDTSDCEGSAFSRFYNLSLVSLARDKAWLEGRLRIEWAFYRPMHSRFRRLEEYEQPHVLRGGLLLGRIGEVDSAPDLDLESALLPGGKHDTVWDAWRRAAKLLYGIDPEEDSRC